MALELGTAARITRPALAWCFAKKGANTTFCQNSSRSAPSGDQHLGVVQLVADLDPHPWRDANVAEPLRLGLWAAAANLLGPS